MSYTNNGFSGSLLAGSVPDTSGWLDGSAQAVPISIVFAGMLAGDSCDVRVSNALVKPSESDPGTIYGAAFSGTSGNGATKITEPFRWIMLRRTAKGSPAGTVSGLLFAHRPPA